MPQTLKQANLFGRGGRDLTVTFIMFYILMLTSSIQLKQAVSRRFEMWHIVALPLPSKVYMCTDQSFFTINMIAICLFQIELKTCQAQQEY